MQAGTAKLLLNLKCTQSLLCERLYIDFLQACGAVSLPSNMCQHARQLMQPTQAWLATLVQSGWLSAVQCSRATFQCLLHVVTAIIKFSASLVIASIRFMLLAAALMILLPTLLTQTCLLVFPSACVLVPFCLLGRVCWPRRYWLPFIGPFRSSSAINHQQQQTAMQAFISSIQTSFQTFRLGRQPKGLQTAGPNT